MVTVGHQDCLPPVKAPPASVKYIGTGRGTFIGSMSTWLETKIKKKRRIFFKALVKELANLGRTHITLQSYIHSVSLKSVFVKIMYYNYKVVQFKYSPTIF